ncbi:MAG: exo-alpha-sialidase [Tannerellaceae bacterium]|nr:exo-alpha-sialidase [Tannerellaceae bacterium]
MKYISLFLFFFLLPCTQAAVDTVYVRQPQIPVLIDRTDNVLLEIRVEADKGDCLNEVVLLLDSEEGVEALQSIRFWYSGVEAPAREGTHFKPVSYISGHAPGKTRQAIASYSVRQDEVVNPGKKVVLRSSQPLVKGINYFWVSIETAPETSLLYTFGAQVESVQVNRQPVAIGGGVQPAIRRLGIGVRHAWDDGSAAYRIPGLVTTNQGTLLGVYDVRYNSSVDLQEQVDIGVSRSTDKGQTWEPMRIAMSFGEYGGLPHAQNGVGDPAILVDEVTGTLWIIAAWTHGMGNGRAWFNSLPGMDPGETAQLMLVRSDDDGQTWSEPINITSQVKDPSWYFLLQGPGRGITMQDGTLVFPVQFIDAERIPHAGVMYSKDRGTTWHIHQAARSNTTEAQVAEVEPGVLMLNMRDNRGGSRAVSVTKDLGKTWEEHVSSRSALREPVCMASLIAIKAHENVTGKEILLFSNPDTTKGRTHITLKASTDKGVTWPREYQVLLDEEENWGYSCLSLIDPETVGILYESSTAHMVFQAVKLKDLLP